MAKPGDVVLREWTRRETHPESGAQVYQMTSAPVIHSNIYCEVAYVDPSSRWVIYLVLNQSCRGVTAEVWRGDLAHPRHWLTNVAEGVVNRGIAVSPDQRYFYCVRPLGDEAFEILRTDIATLEQRATRFDGLGGGPRTLGSVSTDNRTYVYSTYLGGKRFGIMRLDLETGEHGIVYERGADMCNAHPQIDPAGGRDLMIQHNRGAEIDDRGQMLVPFGAIGKSIFLVDLDGRNFRALPIGEPYTRPTQGHQCWCGTSGQLLFTTHAGPTGITREELIAQGNIMTYRPGDEAARVVGRGRYHDHPNVSKDGRFWVADCPESSLIIVGSIETGRSAVLCEAGTSFGSAQFTHAHPYFTPDKEWVIFNSDRTGIPHIFAARLPEGLLDGLAEG